MSQLRWQPLVLARKARSIRWVLSAALAALTLGAILHSTLTAKPIDDPDKENERSNPALAAANHEKVPAPRRDAYGDPLPQGAVARLGSVQLRHPSLSDLCFIQDGKTLLTLGRDHTLRSWDLATGQPGPITRLPGLETAGTGHTITPDGKIVAWKAGSNLIFWDRASGKEITRVPAGESPWNYHYFFLSPDAKKRWQSAPAQ